MNDIRVVFAIYSELGHVCEKANTQILKNRRHRRNMLRFEI